MVKLIGKCPEADCIATVLYCCIIIIMVCFVPQGYPFPVSITMVHLIVKFLLACLVRNIVSHFTGKPSVVLPWKDYLKSITPIGGCVYCIWGGGGGGVAGREGGEGGGGERM